MTPQNFLDTHPASRAFVANLLDRAANLISEQGELLLQDAGLAFPARAASTVLLIGERGAISAADIAAALGQPHQLVTQRVDLLIALEITERVSDPDDGRRKILRLTAKGADQFKRLQETLTKADSAFAGLFQEIGCDLPIILTRMMEALVRSPVLERVKAV